MPTTARLTPLLALASSDHRSSVESRIGGTTLRGTDRDTAAQLIADDAMVVACGSSAVLVRWRQRRTEVKLKQALGCALRRRL